jgi:rod shape-determining protein MreB
MDRGIILTGGGSLLHGMDTLLTKETKIPVSAASSPLSCVAEGTGMALEEIDRLKEVLTSSEMLK